MTSQGTHSAGGQPARCVLMFSGGRDSSLAAARLSERGIDVTLVTVSSSHLVGIERVRTRARELGKLLPPEVPWIVVQQPHHLATDISFYERTCLPCHHAYVVAAAAFARLNGAVDVAFGYVGYQNSWPEQTPLAVSRLSALLDRFGLRLVLPVYEMASREEAISELTARGLTPTASEQKCLRQVSNVSLGEERLAGEIGKWEAALAVSLSSLETIDIKVLESVEIGSL